VNRGRRRELYGFRDEQGLEVDFVVPAGPGRLLLLEAKATRTLRPEMAAPITRLARSMTRYKTRAAVIGLPSQDHTPLAALSPGVRAVRLEDIPSLLP
jgi:hypothetical protein